MKKVFLMVCFVAKTIFCSYSTDNQVQSYDRSEFKKGFFGSTGFFEAKTNDLNSFNELFTTKAKENENTKKRILSCGFDTKSECSFQDLLENRLGRKDLTINDFKRTSSSSDNMFLWKAKNLNVIAPIVIIEYVN